MPKTKITEAEARTALMVGTLEVLQMLKKMGFGRYGVIAIATILTNMPPEGFKATPGAVGAVHDLIERLGKDMAERFNAGEIVEEDSE